tara:strand:- start:24 stop:137 length:114 start_codon:yes stop_codon:yes gene_type:complete
MIMEVAGTLGNKKPSKNWVFCVFQDFLGSHFGGGGGI